jgi:alpha-mannosidase
LSTFRTAAALLKEHDDLIFNHNEALLYRWIKEHDSSLFEEIRRLAEAGRWAVSGGWHLQPDINLPGTESLIRHIEEGQRFFQQYFHAAPRVAYNFDSFGHSGGLPQILVRNGYRMYIHMRPQPDQLDLPSDLYRWQGVDGSEILCYRIAVGLYHTEYDNLEQRLAEGVDLALKLQRDVPVFWGIGDHGGGATRRDLAEIDAFVAGEGRVKIVHSTPDRFYRAVRLAGETAPVFHGGLQRVFTGCYTSLSRLKRRAVESEGLLLQAEAGAAAAFWTEASPFPKERLARAWRDHLFNDFHDILPGTCTEPAERDALDRYGRASESAREIRLKAIAGFNHGAAEEHTIPVTVLNTTPGLGKTPVEVEFMLDHRPRRTGEWHARLFRTDGTPIVLQEEQPEALLPFNGWRRKLVFRDRLPDVGVARYFIEVREGRVPVRKSKPALNLLFSRKSGLVEKLSAPQGGQVLSGSLMRPLKIEDTADSWGTDRSAYREGGGTFRVIPESVGIVEQGAVRTIYESVFRSGSSRIVMHTISWAGRAVLEYRLRIHWNEERKRLKLSLPTVLGSGHAICEIPGGTGQRPGDGQEHVHGRWLRLDGIAQDRKVSLGVAHTGMHGFDLRDGELRLSVLRSAAYCHEQGFELGSFPARKFMDQGIHDVRLLVMLGDTSKVRRRLPALADSLSSPPYALAHWPFGSYPGARGNSKEKRSAQAFQEMLSLKPENVRLLAFKPARDGRGLIIRFREAAGLRTKFKLDMRGLDTACEGEMRPLEIKTLRVSRAGKVRETV